MLSCVGRATVPYWISKRASFATTFVGNAARRSLCDSRQSSVEVSKSRRLEPAARRIVCTKREEPIVKAARRPLQTGPSKGSADSTFGAPTGMP